MGKKEREEHDRLSRQRAEWEKHKVGPPPVSKQYLANLKAHLDRPEE
jgi:hypothetical protein